MATEQPNEDRARRLIADADMRIEVVKREINQGALAGLGSEISDYAAALVVAATDSYDEHLNQQVRMLVADDIKADAKRWEDLPLDPVILGQVAAVYRRCERIALTGSPERTIDQVATEKGGAIDRVRALHTRNANTGTCEHCSERDYPDYAVPWPCATIRALARP